MKVKEVLSEQLTGTFDRSLWFTCGDEALKGLLAEQASWKPSLALNSIWEILAHLNYYNYAYLQRFKGIDYTYPKNENSETFDSGEGNSEEAWKAECDNFSAILGEFRELVEAAADEKFDGEVSPTNKGPWGSVLGQINIHNAHHIGQIVILRKLQGSWDKSVGVS